MTWTSRTWPAPRVKLPVVAGSAPQVSVWGEPAMAHLMPLGMVEVPASMDQETPVPLGSGSDRVVPVEAPAPAELSSFTLKPIWAPALTEAASAALVKTREAQLTVVDPEAVVPVALVDEKVAVLL